MPFVSLPQKKLITTFCGPKIARIVTVCNQCHRVHNLGRTRKVKNLFDGLARRSGTPIGKVDPIYKRPKVTIQDQRGSS